MTTAAQMRNQPWGTITLHPFGLIGENPPTTGKDCCVMPANTPDPRKPINLRNVQLVERDLDLPRHVGTKLRAPLSIKEESSCINPTVVLAILALAAVIFNVLGIMGTANDIVAGANIGLLVLGAAAVIYRGYQTKTLTSTRLILAAILVTSLAFNALALSSLFDMSVIPGQVGGAQLLLLALGGIGLGINHFVNRSKR